MYDKYIEAMIHLMWPEVCELKRTNFITNHGQGTTDWLELDGSNSQVIDNGNGTGQFRFTVKSGQASFVYWADVRWRTPPQVPPNYMYQITGVLAEFEGDMKALTGMLHCFSSNVFPVSYRIGHGTLPNDFQAATIQQLGYHHGHSYAEIVGTDSTGMIDLEIIAKCTYANSLNLPLGKTFTICRPGICPGCIQCGGKIPAMLSPSMGFTIAKGTPSKGMQALIQKYGPSAPVSAMFGTNFTPYQPPVNPPTAMDILHLLETEMPVKVGMLGNTNFMVYRLSIPAATDWKQAVRDAIPDIQAQMGDKIGFIHPDSKITGLSQGSSGATGKFCVNLAYRSEYQHYKVTILALVKA